MMNKSISVVIPVYNEEKALTHTVVTILNYLKKHGIETEIVLVESKSTDKSGKKCDELAKKHKEVVVFHQEAKLGYGNAMRKGFELAKKDYVLMCDADLPYDPSHIMKGLGMIGIADAVLGYKTGKRENIGRWVYSNGYNTLVKVLFGIAVKDINFSYKLIRRTSLQKLDLQSHLWFIDAEILAEMRRHKMGYKQIPIFYTFRETDESKVSLGLRLIRETLSETSEYLFRKKKPLH
jgi:glycosyltransferase involved in cell wall biosynthesis